MSHHIKKCSNCKTIIEQCRCMSEHKEVIWELCATCAKKVVTAVDPNATKIVNCDSVDPKFIHILEGSRLTSAEQKVIDASAALWNMIMELPEVHPMERPEICTAIHDIQSRILARPELRAAGWPERKES